MKKLFYVVMGGAFIVASSCKKDVSGNLDKSAPNAPTATVTLTGIITAATVPTINPGDAVFLDGIVYLDSLATLTIPAGTVITGKTTACGVNPDLTNLANNKGTLVVRRGAKLIANGTPTNPIVWTSANAPGSRNVGDWGGLVIFGQAPIVLASGSTSNNFEAFAALTNGLNSYGGTIANDNSGSITYNRFEFGGGTVTAPNAEVNGVTFCGVGCGTTVNHIEVSNCGDDGFEWFGGNVNADHLLSFANKDDDYDFDEGYNGNLQFIIAYRTNVADNSGSQFIELDGNPTAVAVPGKRTSPIILNATLIGPASCSIAPNCGGASQNGRFDGGITVRRQGRLKLANSYIIAQAMPAAIIATPTTSSSFVTSITTNNDDSWVTNSIFQFTTGTPTIADNDESGPYAPSTCGGASDATADAAGTASVTSSLLAPVFSNSALPDFGAFGLGAFLQNTPASPGFSGGLNAGGVTLGVCSFPLFGTNERGAVPSTDVWTSGAWISIATN
jgi:hypothetical protein